MTIEEFLDARINEVENAGKRLSIQNRFEINRAVGCLREFLVWHINFPVLVQEDYVVETIQDPDNEDNVLYGMSQQIAWLTNQEYIKKFGTEPPTSPLLKSMAMKWYGHPDFDPAWRTDG